MDFDREARAAFFDPRRHVETLADLAGAALRRGQGEAAYVFADRRRRLIPPDANDLLLCAQAARLAGWLDYARADLGAAMERDPHNALVKAAAMKWGDPAQQAEAARLNAETFISGFGFPDSAVSPASAWGGLSATDAEPGEVHVLVPVYDDFEATRLCLDSLRQSDGEGRARIVVIDDATPDRRIRAHLEDLAQDGAIDLLVNPTNRGFAASINRALATCRAGDVLLFNADAIAPPRLVERLRRAIRNAPHAGTATPLSNNGELTNYPSPQVANPPLTFEAALATDALAERANGDGGVDLPSGVGFCLYVTRECLDATGGLSERYRRGYLEDVDFCLRARERGFRNICAAGVFVAHQGARSFRADKRAWVVRNLQLFEPRFPSHRGEVAAFLEADPLRPFRAAIDELGELTEPVVLRLGGRSDRDAGGLTSLEARVSSGGARIDLGRIGEGAPKSLRFELDPAGLAAFDAYVRRLALLRVEIADPAEAPAALLRLAAGWGAPIEILCEDLAMFRGRRSAHGGACETPDVETPCVRCGAVDPGAGAREKLRLALSMAQAVRATDRLSAAFARKVLKGLPLVGEAEPPPRAPYRPEPEGPVLGVLAARPRADVDRLLLRLGRALDRAGAGARLVVMGRCLDDLAAMASDRVHVTGPADPKDYARMIDQYRITRLAVFDRGAGFGRLDRLAAELGGPKAYFDHALGDLPPDERDLPLDPRLCDEKAARQVFEWLGRSFATEESR